MRTGERVTRALPKNTAMPHNAVQGTAWNDQTAFFGNVLVQTV